MHQTSKSVKIDQLTQFQKVTGNFQSEILVQPEYPVLKRPAEKWLRTRKILVLIGSGNLQTEILVSTGISSKNQDSKKTSKDQSVFGSDGCRKFPTRNF